MEPEFREEAPQTPKGETKPAEQKTKTPGIRRSLLPPPVDSALPGVSRLAMPYTNVPTRPRQEIIKYTVQDGDSVFGIAEKFGLKPQTILWGNYNILADDPHSLRPGLELNILPTSSGS